MSRIWVACEDCGYRFERDEPDHPVHWTCEDCFFDRFGDMLTPNELRTMTLRDPERRQQRDEWLSGYERAGIAPDQDPSSFVFSVPVVPGESAAEFTERIVEAGIDAYRLRMSTPEDV